MEGSLNSLSNHTRMSSCLDKRFYVVLLLATTLITSMMILLFGKGDFLSKEREIIIRKRGTLPCNSSASIILDLVQCASTPNECILDSFVCDLIPDCSDQSDESNATCRGIPSCSERVVETCMNNGSCVSHPRTSRRVAYHSCKCTQGYTGEHCEILAPTTTTEAPSSLKLSTTAAEPSTRTVQTSKTQKLETLESGITNTNDIMSNVTDFMHSSLPSSPPTFKQLTSGRMETEPKATSVLTEMTGRPTLWSEATISTLLGDSTTVTTHSTYDISSTATTASKDSKFTITNITTTVPETARSLSPSTIPSALPLSTLPLTTSDGQPQEPTTYSKPPEMTSPSLSTSQWLSTPDGKEGSTTFDGAPDGTATPTTPPLTDVFLQPTSQVSTSPTRVTIQPITEPQDPITPNKVSLVCDEVDRTLSVVECATPNECTINIFVCDGVSDCSDGSDESPATCLGEPACEHEPKLVCENGGTCLSKPRTSQKVAHVTCLCELNFRGETCLEEVDLTTSSSPLSPTPLASTLLSISQSAASTVENTPATVSVTQNTEGTQNTVVSLTTEITSTVIETSRDIEVSSSLTTNPVTRTISNSPATDEPTTENAEVMSPSKDVTSGKSYTTATEVVTSYDTALTTIVFPSTSQELTTDTNPISESSGTSVSRITTPLPFTSDTETQTWTPKSPPTSDITIITEDVPLVSDMTTDHLTTEYEEFTIITEIITIPVSNTDDVTNVNTDTATGEGLGTESSAITEVSTQLLSLRTSTMMIPTVDPSQTITYFEKESTETVTTFDETTDTSTTNERQLATDSATDIGTTESTLGDTTISGVDESQAYSTSTPFEVIGTQSDITSTKESSDYPTTMEGTRTFERETDYPMKRTTEASGTQSDITVMVSDGKTSHTVGKATEASSSTESDTTIYTRSTEYPMVKTTETSSTQSDASISSEGTTDYKMVKTTEASTITIDTTTENTNTHIDMSSVTSLQSTHPSTTQATLSIETTTELITTHADTQTSGLDPTDDSKTQRTSTVTLTSLLLSTSAIQTTDRKASTTEEEGDQGTHFGSTTDQNTVTSSRFETSKIFSTTDTSSSTTAGRSASSERVVLIVLLSTAAVIVFSIACLILVGCCIARKWREKNFYPDDDQTPLRSPQTYSQQSNRGKKYTYGQNHQENNKPSFAHRLKPFQSTKVEYESDLTDAPSLSSPSPTTLSIINDYFEQMHSVYNGLEPDGNRNNSTERHYEGTDLGSESFEMRFFPDTEYWMPSSSSDVTDIPYYITDDAPLPVSHV